MISYWRRRRHQLPFNSLAWSSENVLAVQKFSHERQSSDPAATNAAGIEKLIQWVYRAVCKGTVSYFKHAFYTSTHEDKALPRPTFVFLNQLTKCRLAEKQPFIISKNKKNNTHNDCNWFFFFFFENKLASSALKAKINWANKHLNFKRQWAGRGHVNPDNTLWCCGVGLGKQWEHPKDTCSNELSVDNTV